MFYYRDLCIYSIVKQHVKLELHPTQWVYKLPHTIMLSNIKKMNVYLGKSTNANLVHVNFKQCLLVNQAVVPQM